MLYCLPVGSARPFKQCRSWQCRFFVHLYENCHCIVTGFCNEIWRDVSNFNENVRYDTNLTMHRPVLVKWILVQGIFQRKMPEDGQINLCHMLMFCEGFLKNRKLRRAGKSKITKHFLNIFDILNMCSNLDK